MRAALFLFSALALLGASACRTAAGDDAAAIASADETLTTSPLTELEPPSTVRASGGYFVALPAMSASPKVVELYDALYSSLETLARSKARADGALSAYVEELGATGFTALAVADDEIECDRERCLLKLSGRVLRSVGEKPSASFAAQLTVALELDGVKPRVENGVRTFSLGDTQSLGLACEQAADVYICRFNLDSVPAPSTGAATESGQGGERGRLASCAQSPGVVRAAEEARDGGEGGGLLKLADGPSEVAPAVGFLRYATGSGVAGVELMELYLCGDVSHDTLQIAQAARDPRTWIPSDAKVGSVVTLAPARQDEAQARLRATVVQESATDFTLEVKFTLEAEGASAADVYGDDLIFLKLAKSWLGK